MLKFLEKTKNRLLPDDYLFVENFYNKIEKQCQSPKQQQLLSFGLENTLIMFPLELDYDMILASIVLPLIRDNQLDLSNLTEYQSAIDLVNVVLKIETINLSEDAEVEDVRSMLVAMAKDIRVIILKLADTLNRARHLKYLTEDQKVKLHKNIVNIYVPLASRLGINYIKSELQDLDLSYTQPNVYKRLMEFRNLL